MFDESCEHEVRIPKSASFDRIVLIADFANPFLKSEKDYLSAMVSPQGSAHWSHSSLLARLKELEMPDGSAQDRARQKAAIGSTNAPIGFEREL